MSEPLSFSWFPFDPVDLVNTLWSGSLIRFMIQVEMLRLLVQGYVGVKGLCWHLDPGLESSCALSTSPQLLLWMKVEKVCFVHACFNAWGGKKITEDFEMLVKILELKPIGLKVRVRWQTLLYEIFLKSTIVRNLLVQFLVFYNKLIVLKSLHIQCFCRCNSVGCTWVFAMSVWCRRGEKDDGWDTRMDA